MILTHYTPVQAYYSNGATPPFFTSPVAAPAPHPYMWGGQVNQP